MKNYWLEERKNSFELENPPSRTDIVRIEDVSPIFSPPRIYIPQKIHRKVTLREGLALLVWQCLICWDMLESQEDGEVPVCHRMPMRLLEFTTP